MVVVVSDQLPCNRLVGQSHITVTAGALVQIDIMQTTPSPVYVAQSVDFRATGTYGFHPTTTQADITDQVAWNDITGHILFDGIVPGRGRAVAVGNASVQATSGLINSPALLVPITQPMAVALTIEPSAPSGIPGDQITLRAFLDYTHGIPSQDITNEVKWNSSNVAVASFGPNTSVLVVQPSALPNDIATITATDTFNPPRAAPATATLTVGSSALAALGVSAASSSVKVSQTVQMQATGFYSVGPGRDITDSVNWDVSRGSSYCRVDHRGLVTARRTRSRDRPAECTITAQHPGSLITGNALVTVIAPLIKRIYFEDPPLNVPMSSLTLRVNRTKTLKVMAEYEFPGIDDEIGDTLEWSSTEPLNVDVDNSGSSRGRIKGLQAGTSSIVAAKIDPARCVAPNCSPHEISTIVTVGM
ncbi:MAG: hypothetical protein MJD61_19350 [Proteobacteria bacterium]|nr:hypothetical protein [Pseudomonadota bacterium]